MDNIVKRIWLFDLAALVMVIAVFLGGTYIVYLNYNSTIRNVQSLDFSLLASTLPRVLPEILQAQDSPAIEEIVQLPRGLFGVAVLDAQGRQWITESPLQDYSKTLAERHDGAVFSVPIRSQPYACKDWLDGCQKSLQIVSSKTLGTLYLIRRTPPTYFASMSKWTQLALAEPLRVASYSALLLIALLIGAIYWLIRARYKAALHSRDVLKRTMTLLQAQIRLRKQVEGN